MDRKIITETKECPANRKLPQRPLLSLPIAGCHHKGEAQASYVGWLSKWCKRSRVWKLSICIVCICFYSSCRS